MRKELKDDIWESYLKTAVIQNSLKEIENYPPREEINDIELPEHFEANMLKCAKHHHHKAITKTALLYVRKAASIVILILGIGFALFLQNEEVRAACQNAVFQIYERYIRILFKTTAFENNESVKIGYIPEGFSVVIDSSDETDGFILYENIQNDIIEFYYFKEEHVAYVDNEHYINYNVLINNVEGTFFESQDLEFMNLLYWNTDKAYFQINSTLEKSEIIKIAEKIN